MRRRRVETVLSVVSPPSARFGRSLSYAQRTRQASPGRPCRAQSPPEAREPDELLFRVLPDALGLDSIPPQAEMAANSCAAYAMRREEQSSSCARIPGSWTTLRGLAAALSRVRSRCALDLQVRAARLEGQISEPHSAHSPWPCLMPNSIGRTGSSTSAWWSRTFRRFVVGRRSPARSAAAHLGRGVPPRRGPALPSCRHSDERLRLQSALRRTLPDIVDLGQVVWVTKLLERAPTTC